MLTKTEPSSQSLQSTAASEPLAQQPEFRSVTMMGLGYIGLPTAAVIASRGFDVVGVDVNEDIVNKISSAQIHIYGIRTGWFRKSSRRVH